MTVFPSGEQVEIAKGRVRAWVVEVGGGLRALRFADHDIFDGYEQNEMASAGRGQLLLPWPNRIRDGFYTFDGHELQLPLTEPGLHNAIHGLTRWANWTVAHRDVDRVTMQHRLYPSPGYPFTVDLAVKYVVSDSGLSVSTTATNIGTQRLPFAAGAHPYLRIGSGLVDNALLRVPASMFLRTDERSIPIETVTVEGSEVDFRVPRRIRTAILDVAYTQLERDEEGHASVELNSSESDLRITVWMDKAHRYVVIFSGDTVLPISRRRYGLAIEPMTSPPNAFASNTDVMVVQPGETVAMTWGLRMSDTAG